MASADARRLDASLDLALAADVVPCFGDFTITERDGSFPPPDAAACWVYVTLNAEIALAGPERPALQRLLRSPRARVSVDGQWVWWALRRKYRGDAAIAKLSGSELIHRLAQHANHHGRRLLLLGTTPALNARAVQRLRQAWPGLVVAGYAPPPVRAGDEPDAALLHGALEAVAAFEPDYVVLGLGAAKEHPLAAALAPPLDGRVRGVLCFGGAIDMASGAVTRAPRWCQRLGLEGLYRVWQQPRRFGRLLRLLPRWAALLARGAY